MAKAEKIEIPVEIDWDKAIKGFEVLALVFDRFAFQARHAGKMLARIAEAKPVDKESTSR